MNDKIVTGITTEFKLNPENPKYFAKLEKGNMMCFGNTEIEAIERLRKYYESYNESASTIKFEKYFKIGISIEFFTLIEEDPYLQIDDTYILKDLELNPQQIQLINLTYNLQVKQDDIVVEIFEEIENNY